MTEQKKWRELIIAIKGKIKGIITNTFQRTKAPENISTWEEKVLERELKTKEAKKIWEEKRMQLKKIESKQTGMEIEAGIKSEELNGNS